MEKDKEPLDVFESALAESIQALPTIINQEVNITQNNVGLPVTPKTRKTWKELKVAIDNEHAHRFNNVLNDLPDREFVRVYLKALEFFKPKVIRQGGGQGEVIDQTINIQVNYGDKNPK